MPYPNEHAARLASPDNFQKDSMRSKKIAPGIRILVGRLKGKETTTTQAYRFDKDTFTAAEAREWLKDHNINYLSFETAIENLFELYSVGNAIGSKHDVVLQRLDTLIKNNGRMILYSADAFQNTALWKGVPVIFAQTEGENLQHPSKEDVDNNTLPDRYRVVGRVTSANIGAGEPALKGEIEIDDPTLDKMTSAGEMSLSTGFSASVENVNGQDQIVGNISPNHVLIFKRGACRNCFPNDNSARFENTKENEDMVDEETKSIFKKLTEAIENLKPASPEQKPKETDMNTEEMKNLAEERDALKAKLEAMENAAEQTKKDAAWSEMKNLLPEGWVGDKEADTRKEFEANNVAFAIKFAKFAAENSTPAKAAEGSGTGAADIDPKMVEMKNMIEDMGKRTGFVLVGGDE